jgi:glycosyltransferase involved in cell wall biosynthesis
MTAPLLSILVPTVPSRVATMFPKAIQAILGQITDHKEVELLGLFDNKARTTGAKRNALLDIARGEYVVFIDDDDWVELMVAVSFVCTTSPPLRAVT